LGLRRLSFDGKVSDKFSDLEPGDYVELMVSDTGHGMAERIVGRIFDPFFTTKHDGQWVGFGYFLFHNR